MKDLKIELKHFTWHKDKRLLTTELSNLPVDQQRELPFYITISNPDTKQSRVFRYLATDKDKEGDITAWHYENLSHSLRLTIWND